MASYSDFKSQSRLPKFASPKRYDIRLKPDLTTCKFQGVVSIDVDVVSPTKHLVLNAADLNVDSSSVSFIPKSTSKEIRASGVGLIEEDEILVVEFGEELPLGIGVLNISFQGTLNDQMKGFYRSVYEINGEKKNMAVTQFEPADARRCFPCWDEPAAKATFKITLDVPSNLVALSNMPVIEEKKEGDLKTVYFEESPIMSTYLVAVVVGLFDFVESHASDGVKVRCYCQVGKSDQGKFALEVAVKTLDLYRKYFDVPYALPKLDMIAIPDFAAGAMENYGLVTYRENALLYDEKHSAAANKQRVAIVVAHELAHQWFGNLVTMEWWTHLWLNEGFATWVSYLAADALFPEWKIWTQFLDQTTDGLRLDGLSESHPIEVEINHASEIDEIFDAISYRKGASLIRMLQSYIGADTFQRALACYIKKYACSNAKTEDLWAVLEEVSIEPVKELMNSWTQQKGYPVVSVKMIDQKLELEQSLFLLSGSPGDSQWIVPITLCCGSYDNRRSYLLKEKSGSLDIKESAWFKLNVDQTGFYRVKYDEELEARLRHAIESSQLSATDRFGVLDDSFALCTSGQQSMTTLLTLMASFREETEYTISYKIMRIVADATPDLVDNLKKFLISLFEYPARRLGWESTPGESHLDAMLRGELLTVLAQLGHESTLNEASRRFDAFCADRDSPLLPPDTRKATYTAVMQKVNASNRSAFEALLKVYRETDLSQEKGRIIGSLASCPDPDIVLEVLNFLLSSEVRSQDAIFGLSVSKEGRETAWIWLQDKWDYISKTWGSGYLITRFISTIVSPFSTTEKAKEIEEFFASRMKPTIARTLRQSLERVQINARWVQAVQKDNRLAQLVQDMCS
ncbi:aminopeptidase M1 isoform X2 [Beta vulgaris subsp. vulgaris]|uniref:aminopeptidase M1 isoform X2 n=1 Tax=Beta vulgaris subsp. vulgaris TaxID=3555 RepID=UPI002036DF6B|nr:aminopeptidase M1 isoform X2 [Beta vulgaris subsp. vulgaris]